MKILIISNNPFSDELNNGKTLSSFFSSVNPKDLAQFYTNTSQCPNDVCSNFYRVTESDILHSIINFSFKSNNSYFIRKQGVISTNSSPKDSKIIKYFKKNKKLFQLCRESLWALRTWDTKEFNNWIKEFNPDVIFAVLGNCIYSHKIATIISKRFHIPLAVYFTDDYFINDVSSNIIEKFHHKLLKKIYKETISIAESLYVIGDNMKIDYEHIFNKKFETLVNSVDFMEYSIIPAIKLDTKKKIIISYLGGLHLNRWKSLIQFSCLCNKLKNKYNFNLIIKVFSMTIPDSNLLKDFEKNNIEYCGSLKKSEIIDQISKSHFLLHVESFDLNSKLSTKYSISTKIPEYLASKRYVIAFGPSDVASISLFSECNFGCCLTELDNEEDKLLKITSAINNYNSYDFESQYLYSFNKFNQEKVSQKLLDNLHKLI